MLSTQAVEEYFIMALLVDRHHTVLAGVSLLAHDPPDEVLAVGAVHRLAEESGQENMVFMNVGPQSPNFIPNFLQINFIQMIGTG